MRIIVLFDLPTGSKKERKTYAAFRKFLISDGYTMEQFSVYSRVTLGRDNANTHLARLRENLPAASRVTAFCITEKQYEDRMVLVCTGGYEIKNNDIGEQLTIFL